MALLCAALCSLGRGGLIRDFLFDLVEGEDVAGSCAQNDSKDCEVNITGGNHDSNYEPQRRREMMILLLCASAVTVSVTVSSAWTCSFLRLSAPFRRRLSLWRSQRRS